MQGDTTNALTLAQNPTDRGLSMVITAQEATERLAELQAFVRSVMIVGEDYGIIPGTGTKPTLLKPGAEKLLEIYGLVATVEVANRIEIWEGNGFFHYECRCVLTQRDSGIVVATGLGSCNSKEARYRWRDGGRKCPDCGAAAIIKGKAEYGGGFLCFAKKGGCGAKFAENAAAILNQPQGRVENDDIFSQVNVILKIAAKRAIVDGTLRATRSSALFTQDLEDLAGGGDDDGPVARPAAQQNRQQPAPQNHRPASQPPAGRVIDVTPTPANNNADHEQRAAQDDALSALLDKHARGRGNADALFSSIGGSWDRIPTVKRDDALTWLGKLFAAEDADLAALAAQEGQEAEA